MKETTAVIKVDHVAKNFILPHEKTATLKGAFTSMLRNKDKGFETQHALRDINFEVRKGEFFGIVGRNGSGKSTLLKLLAGIYQPTRGMISTQGKLVPFIELGVGFNPELTGRENVYLNGALLGFSRKEIDKVYDDIVDFAELERFMDQKLKNYSSGMQVRLAFSTATRAKADVLIVDEVLAVGDADFQKKCFTYFKSLKNTGTTVILVTHDMGSVREYCDRAILLEGGDIIDEGDADKVSRSYSELFNPLSHGEASAARWGDQLIQIKKVHAKAANEDTSGRVHITADVQAREDIDDDEVTIAYAVKDEVGLKLFGNKVSASEFGNLKKGDSREFTFSFENHMNAGKYFIDISLYSEKRESYYDCWIDCADFVSKLKGVKGYPMIVEDEVSFGRS